MSKKTKRALYKTKSSIDPEYSTVIKITIGVICVFLFTYLLTALASGEIKLGKKDNNTKQEVSIQYEEIIAGQVLNRNHEEYYVLLFDFTDTFASYYLSLKDNYLMDDKALPFYIVDLEKHINKTLVSEDGHDITINVSHIDNLKVVSPTIIKIKGHKVVETIKGRESILKFFNQ